MKRHRDAGTGEFVSKDFAEANPGTTVSEATAPADRVAALLAAARVAAGAMNHSAPCHNEYWQAVEALEAAIAAFDA